MFQLKKNLPRDDHHLCGGLYSASSRTSFTNKFDTRIVQFYPTVAIITLFLNILMNPLDGQAQKDLELLASAADIFRLIPARQYTPQRLDQVQILESFVIELARLGRCAVYKKEAELGGR